MRPENCRKIPVDEILATSLFPFLRTRDRIVVEFFDDRHPPDLTTGDLAFFRHDDHWAIRRVIIDEKGLHLKSDQLSYFDVPGHRNVPIRGRVRGIAAGNQEILWKRTSPPLGNLLAWLSIFNNRVVPLPTRFLARTLTAIGSLGTRSWLDVVSLAKKLRLAMTIARSQAPDQALTPTTQIIDRALTPNEGAAFDRARSWLLPRGAFKRCLTLDASTTSTLSRSFQETVSSIDSAQTGNFDLIWISESHLATVRGQKDRILLLKQLSALLSPAGILVTFPSIRPLKTGEDLWLNSLALKWKLGSHEWEEGDSIDPAIHETSGFRHYYPNPGAFAAEVSEAGLTPVWIPPVLNTSQAHGWLLRRVSI